MADPLSRLTSDERMALLLHAWSSGAFPMADGRHGKVSFYSADPRSILPLEEGGLTASRSLRSLVRSGRFEVRSDTAFARVIRACADTPRGGEAAAGGCWINDWIIDSYDALHATGHAHSIEAYLDGELVGGLYGVHIGGVFFGESMFTRRARRTAERARCALFTCGAICAAADSRCWTRSTPTTTCGASGSWKCPNAGSPGCSKTG
ncbi:MAG: leucyl/phenylalanyl-tRNA--protein transferase [Phycisphaerales bacterium]